MPDAVVLGRVKWGRFLPYGRKEGMDCMLGIRWRYMDIGRGDRRVRVRGNAVSYLI